MSKSENRDASSRKDPSVAEFLAWQRGEASQER